MRIEGLSLDKRTQLVKAYKLDISETTCEGSFLCPNCGMKISPDDQSEATYIIADVKLKDNKLDEVTINCKRCLSNIYLSGFSEISKHAQN